MGSGGRMQRPGSTPRAGDVDQATDPDYVPRGDPSLWPALAHFAGQPIRRKAGASSAAEEKEAEVSQPGDAAEVEADAVADNVADKLHGSEAGAKREKEEKAAEADDKEAGEEKAPEIGAKLQGVGLKIYRAGKDPLRPGTRNALGSDPTTRGMRVGNAQQAGVALPPQHHVFPQEQRPWFKQRGVEVDDYCVNLDQARHEAIHKMDWNGRVMSLLKEAEKGKKGKRLSGGEMVALVRPLMGEFKIGGLSFVKYGSERPQEH